MDVTAPRTCIVKTNLFNADYIKTKEQRMRHFMEEGSWCYRDHGGDA